MKKIVRWYENITDKTISKLGKYAANKFVQSDFTLMKASIIPLTLISSCIRIIFNFLILNNLKTGNGPVDFSVSILSTVFTTLITPIYYDTILYLWEKDVVEFTKFVIESLWHKDGWDFFETWKSRILGGTVIGIIFLLCFIEVTSFKIQIFLTHTLISAVISDYILVWFQTIGKRNEYVPKTKIFNLPEELNIMKSYSPINKGEIEIIQNYVPVTGKTSAPKVSIHRKRAPSLKKNLPL